MKVWPSFGIEELNGSREARVWMFEPHFRSDAVVFRSFRLGGIVYREDVVVIRSLKTWGCYGNMVH